MEQNPSNLINCHFLMPGQQCPCYSIALPQAPAPGQRVHFEPEAGVSDAFKVLMVSWFYEGGVHHPKGTPAEFAGLFGCHPGTVTAMVYVKHMGRFEMDEEGEAQLVE